MPDFIMPPGVSVMDIPGWDPDEGILICKECGFDLTFGDPTAYLVKEIVTSERGWCNGVVRDIFDIADGDYYNSVLGIIGEGHRGERWYVGSMVECQQEMVDQSYPSHEPHWFDMFPDIHRVILKCPKGHETVIDYV